MSASKNYCCHVSPVVAQLLVVLTITGSAREATAYVPDTRWSTTASGSTGTPGTPIMLTWSLLQDGTNISTEGGSNLIGYLDGIFNVTSSSGPLSQRPWFHLFQESFDRWSQLGGITFVYEPNDTGTLNQTNNGALGVRGDIRIGGALIDGDSGTLAYTYLPNGGDMVIDTGETNFYANSTNNYRQLRNTVMHELGHAFGLNHLESSSDNLLMEPFINTSFDGPQLDDVRGIQGYYGDKFEKSNSGLGNDTSSRATSLGSLALGSNLAIGSDAVGGQSVNPSETDFVSIENTDVDFYSFTVSAPALLDVTLTPLGGVFMQGTEGGVQSSFDANARNDLALAVFAPNGTTLLGSANLSAAGLSEVLNDLQLTTAGTYFTRIIGAATNLQLYQLQLSATALVIALPGDYNHDNVVDAEDYAIWRNMLGQSGAGLAADGNGNGTVDVGDYGVWKANFGRTSGGGSGSAVSLATVPEPTCPTLLAVAALIYFSRRRTPK
jgi:serralysin